MKKILSTCLVLLLYLQANAQCIPADTPVISAPAGYTVCEGELITISWTGNLNDNTYWIFYDDWFATYDTVYTNSVTFPAIQWGEYFVWGSGGCGSDGIPANVYVDANPSYTQLVGQQRVCNGDSLLIFGQYQSVSGIYTDSLQTVSGCDSLQHFELIVDPLLTDQQITPAQTYLCDTAAVTINMAASENGVKYYLRDDANDQVVDGPFIGDGSAMAFNTGTVVSTTSYHVYGERPSYGASFDTTANYLSSSTGEPVTLNDNNVTIECWIKWDGITDNGFANGVKTILVNGHEGYGGYALRLQGSDSTLYVLFGGVGYLYTTYKVIPDTWTHIAVTGTTSNLWTYYVNGDSISSTIINNNPPYSWHVFHVGVDVLGTAPFDGTIDDVRVWETVRTQAEIQQDMNTCLTGSETDLVAYYSFEHGGTDQGSGGVNLLENKYAGSPWTTGVDHCNLCGTEMSTIAIVEIVDVNSTVSISDVTLTANQAGASYQWVDCNNGNAPIAGETGQSFTPVANGSYAVEVTVNGCTETSACENIATIGISELEDLFFKIYPNPNHGVFTFETAGSSAGPVDVKIYDLLGQVVFETHYTTQGKHAIDLGMVRGGMYTLRIHTNEGQTSQRLIIE